MLNFAAGNPITGYNLTRSLRLRRSATAYLNRTPASAGNRKTWTWSAWFKRGSISGVEMGLFDAVASSGTDSIGFRTDETLTMYFANAANGNLTTTQVFRDPSAWYHIVIALDTTQATASNRVKIYLNGTQITAFTTSSYPAQNLDCGWNNSVAQNIGRKTSAADYFDGYLTEVNFIDGQALTPSSFGSTNSLTGVWQPAAYTGTYGTNGFYLPFTDNSALTTSSNVGLGKDFSGNANYWVTNNISITAGVTYDSMTDVPTLTSATASNFAVANPVDQYLCSITQGNLSVATNNGGYGGGVRSTIAVSSGKWYWESVITVLGGSAGQAPVVGIIPSTTPINAIGSNTRYAYYGGTGNKLSSAGSVAYGATFSTGDVIGYALDLDAGTLTFYKNNTSQGTAFTGLSGSFCAAVYDPSTGGTTAVNFGQRPFAYTPPTGFVALNTFNLPTSTIVKGNTVMDATLWTGNSSTQSITNAASFQPNFVWIKNRTGANSHALFDSVRGATKRLYSDATLDEQTEATTLTAFNSNGFSLSSSGAVNLSANNYVGWQWLESASAGFDIVTFTGNGGGQTFSHNLGVPPGLMICKSRNNAQDWYVYHSSIGGTGALSLNTTAATATSVNYWSNVTPGSSTFSVGGNFSSGYTYVNYLFAPIAGFSAFGSYTGNGSTDGPFVYTGFRPKFIMIKRSGTAGNSWRIWDTARAPYNAGLPALYPNQSDAEDSITDVYDLVSNGFKLRTSAAGTNASSSTYIYMAFAENPFKNALAR